jgi:putative transposase
LLERSSPSSLSDAGRSTPRESPLDKQKGVQGSQSTSAAFTGALAEAGVAISMDGRGRWMDDVFIERLWRSLKYEDVYLKGYADGREAARDIAEWVAFYNDQRPH